MMDDWTLELVMIGTQPAERPFYNDYNDKDRLDKLRKTAALLVERNGFNAERRILIEETYVEG